MRAPDLRRQLLNEGAVGMRDEELVAVLLGTGAAGLHVLDVARALLHRYGTLAGLLAADRIQLVREPGLGTAKVARLVAGVELARRAAFEPLRSARVFTDSAEVGRYLGQRMGALVREEFAALFLDTRHRLLRFETLFTGTLDSASVHPREVLKSALALNAGAVILAHNHPSGVAEPSDADLALTRRLATLFDLVGIRLLDHVVIGRGVAVSFAERGLL